MIIFYIPAGQTTILTVLCKYTINGIEATAIIVCRLSSNYMSVEQGNPHWCGTFFV